MKCKSGDLVMSKWVYEMQGGFGNGKLESGNGKLGFGNDKLELGNGRLRVW